MKMPEKQKRCNCMFEAFANTTSTQKRLQLIDNRCYIKNLYINGRNYSKLFRPHHRLFTRPPPVQNCNTDDECTIDEWEDDESTTENSQNSEQTYGKKVSGDFNNAGSNEDDTEESTLSFMLCENDEIGLSAPSVMPHQESSQHVHNHFNGTFHSIKSTKQKVDAPRAEDDNSHLGVSIREKKETIVDLHTDPDMRGEVSMTSLKLYEEDLEVTDSSNSQNENAVEMRTYSSGYPETSGASNFFLLDESGSCSTSKSVITFDSKKQNCTKNLDDQISLISNGSGDQFKQEGNETDAETMTKEVVDVDIHSNLRAAVEKEHEEKSAMYKINENSIGYFAENSIQTISSEETPVVSNANPVDMLENSYPAYKGKVLKLMDGKSSEDVYKDETEKLIDCSNDESSVHNFTAEELNEHGMCTLDGIQENSKFDVIIKKSPSDKITELSELDSESSIKNLSTESRSPTDVDGNYNFDDTWINVRNSGLNVCIEMSEEGGSAKECRGHRSEMHLTDEESITLKTCDNSCQSEIEGKPAKFDTEEHSDKSHVIEISTQAEVIDAETCISDDNESSSEISDQSKVNSTAEVCIDESSDDDFVKSMSEAGKYSTKNRLVEKLAALFQNKTCKTYNSNVTPDMYVKDHEFERHRILEKCIKDLMEEVFTQNDMTETLIPHVTRENHTQNEIAMSIGDEIDENERDNEFDQMSSLDTFDCIYSETNGSKKIEVIDIDDQEEIPNANFSGKILKFEPINMSDDIKEHSSCVPEYDVSDHNALEKRSLSNELDNEITQSETECEEEILSGSTLPFGIDSNPDDNHVRKKAIKYKKRFRKRGKRRGLPRRETSSSWNENFSIVLSYHCRSSSLSLHRRNRKDRPLRPRRKKIVHQGKTPSDNDSSDIKLVSSIQKDSGIGASLEIYPWTLEIPHKVGSQIIKNRNNKSTTKSFRSLRLMKNSNCFKKQCNKFFSKRLKQKVKSIVAELHIEDRWLQVFGLGSYFDRLNTGPPSLQEQMRYEWLRLASFQRYGGAGNALHLARNGFYHRETDSPTTTRCAYCDVTYSDWEYFDNVESTHRQISPGCPFHGGSSNESINVSISCDGPSSTNDASSHQNSNSQSSSSENSAVKTLTESGSLAQASCTTENATLDVSEITKKLDATHVSQAKASNFQGESVPQQPSEDPEESERPLNPPQRSAGTISSADLPPMPQRNASRGNGQHAANGNFTDPVRKHATQVPPPNNSADTSEVLENVKHPEFRTMTQRVNSFNGFPDYLDQTPEQMALAGFYFVGVADFTRCFCCGGGLRNWEAGDDPLLEHTRWFPRCEYVRRLKGERYVAAVQRRHEQHMEEQRRQQLEIASQRDANRNPPDPMTTDAARVMREMGYTDGKIRETILAARRDMGTHLITSQQVLSWLLDHDNSENTNTRTSSTYSENDNNSIYSGINMTSDRDQSVESEANFVTAQSSINPPASATALKASDALQTSGAQGGTSNTNSASSNRNQQTTQKSGSHAASGQSGQTGLKKAGKKKKGKSATPGQTSGATSGTRVEAAKKLQAENEKLRDMQTCKICMERLVNTTLLPCGHLVCCDICASRLRDCPICRKRIKGTVKTFMS